MSEQVKPASEQKPDSDGWIKWEGGERPLRSKVIAQIMFSDGDTEHGPADSFYWDWKSKGTGGDIVAYRTYKDGTIPQPDYKAQRDADRYRWLRDQFWCEQEATFRLSLPDTESATVYHDALDAAIDAAIASVKGGA